MTEQEHVAALARVLQHARVSAAKGQWAEAAPFYEAAFELAPSNVEVLEGLGLVALHGGQPERSLSWFTRAREHSPPNASLLGLIGVAQKRMGRLSDAIESYRLALTLNPQDFALLVNLARALRETGELEQSIYFFERALRIQPESAEAFSMLSNVLREHKKTDAALDAARKAIAIDPQLAQGHLNHGAALQQLGRLDDAIVSYFLAVTLNPRDAAASLNLERALASVTMKSGQSVQWVRKLLVDKDDAATVTALAKSERKRGHTANALLLYERAVQLSPTPDLLRQAARMLRQQGHTKRATEYLTQAITQDPTDIAAHRLLGAWFASEGAAAAAETHFRKVLALCPDDVVAQVNLGASLTRQGRPVAATRILEKAVSLAPDRVEAYINLGTALSDQGRFSEARAVYQRGIALDPTRKELVSNLLFSMHFDPLVTPSELFQAHVSFAKLIESTVKPSQHRHVSQRDPQRTLRIGLVSPDFREHPVGYLLEPFLREHDPRHFQLHGYSDVRHPDRATARHRELVEVYTDCTALDDAELAEKICADEIDILVDLAGHTAQNRLGVFARKPAPLQVSWLGYFNTTGLRAIDYRLTDIESVPASLNLYFTEKLVRLPRTSNNYLPPLSPPVSPAPVLKQGFVTFGCFNNPAKLTREGVKTFARILQGLKTSRLILKYGAYSDPEMRDKYLAWFAEEGVLANRIEFRNHSSMSNYLSEFADIDLALDTFPYSGETTALHTLWMGVPLVALEGTTLVQRLASRVLRIAGFPSWVAHSPEEYATIALSLAGNLDVLVTRQAIREKLQACPLLDYFGVTRDVEAALRRMWIDFCRNKPR